MRRAYLPVWLWVATALLSGMVSLGQNPGDAGDLHAGDRGTALSVGRWVEGGTSVAAGTAVVVDWRSTYQTWEGFGASSMFYEDNLMRLGEPARTEVFDLIFRDLGATILAIRLYSDFQPSEGAPYNWSAMANQRAICQAALARGVIDRIWARVSSPPGWMKTNGSPINGGHVRPEYYDEYAAYCRDYVLGMQNTYGIPIHAFAIFNEPGHSHPYETTETTPEEFRDILKVVGADFDAHGLAGVRQFAPDSPMLQILENYTGYNYLRTIAEDPVALGYLDVISVHSYDDKAGNGPWAQCRSAAAAAGRPIWQTEVCNLSSAQHNIFGACWGSWWAHRAINIGQVTAWHWWQYHFPQEATADQGLVALTRTGGYVVYPRYYMLRQWAKHVRPGAVRVSAASDNADLHVSAFKDGDVVVIVATNFRYGGGAVETLATFTCPAIRGDVAHVRTSATENHAGQPPIHPTGDSFSVIIPALTINTFIVPVAATTPGDMNCDGSVNFDDINPFVLALSDPGGYAAAYPNCYILNGDCNGDGAVDFGDINPFVGLLTR
ncbi:MAG: hypothetical protein AB1716_07935 [Planctomycetota bacterium]